MAMDSTLGVPIMLLLFLSTPRTPTGSQSCQRKAINGSSERANIAKRVVYLFRGLHIGTGGILLQGSRHPERSPIADLPPSARPPWWGEPDTCHLLKSTRVLDTGESSILGEPFLLSAFPRRVGVPASETS